MTHPDAERLERLTNLLVRYGWMYRDDDAGRRFFRCKAGEVFVTRGALPEDFDEFMGGLGWTGLPSREELAAI